MKNFKQDIEFFSRDQNQTDSVYSQTEFPSERELADFAFIQIKPGCWKIEIETPINTVFFTLITVLNGLIFLLLWLLQAELFVGYAVRIILIAASLSSILSALLRSTGSCFVIDRNAAIIDYRLQTLLFSRKHGVATFSEVIYVTAGGNNRADSFDNSVISAYRQIEDAKEATFRTGSIWRESMGFYTPFKSALNHADGQWLYAPFLVLRDGSVLQIADFDCKSIALANHKAKILSQLIGCSHVSAPAESLLKVEFDDISGELKIIHQAKTERK